MPSPPLRSQQGSLRQRPHNHVSMAFKTKRNGTRRRSYRRRRRAVRRRDKRRGNATKSWVQKRFGNTGVYYYNLYQNDWQPTDLNTWLANDAIARGTNRGERVGDYIFCKSIDIQVKLRNISTTDNMYVRMFCAIDKHPGEFEANKMFEAESNIAAPANWIGGNVSDAFLKVINRKRYTVLCERKYLLHADNVGGTGPYAPSTRSLAMHKIHIPINRRIAYTTSADPDIKCTPKILVFWMVASHKNVNSFTTGTVTRNCWYRIRYDV